MKNQLMTISLFFLILLHFSCQEPQVPLDNEVYGYSLLQEIPGHWVGNNETVYGNYDWFCFDFRPISNSHVHSIYEGATAQNIINSFFIAEYEGRRQVMARNGGWLFDQYRATYFVLDQAEETVAYQYYRLVDAVGGEDRAYMELLFRNDSLYFDAYKDNSGMLDQPIHHMGFAGLNIGTTYSDAAADVVNYPTDDSEVNLNIAFIEENLIDPDSALFLEESKDPFPKSAHHHISDLIVEIERSAAVEEQQLMFYLSADAIVKANGSIDYTALENSVFRTIDIAPQENSYTATYVHPAEYYITIFKDNDGNGYPSSGDVTNKSSYVNVLAEDIISATVNVDFSIP